MKWFILLFRMRFQSIAVQPVLWLLLVLSMAFSLIPINTYLNHEEGTIPVAIVNRDEGSHSKTFVEEIRKIEVIRFVEEESLSDANRKLSIGEYEGVLVINQEFSSQIDQAEFSDLLLINMSPSSLIAPFFAEIFSEKALRIWSQAFLLQDYEQFRSEEGNPMTGEELEELREELLEASRLEKFISLNFNHSLPISNLPEKSMSAEVALKQSALYYCSLVIIFILISSRWVIDQRKTGIGLRMRSLGITPALASFASGSAMAVYCIGFLVISLSISAFMAEASVLVLLRILLSALFYFFSSIGLALIISSLIKESISLMLLSPLAVLINTILGGMIQPLPEWAVFLGKISVVLPGRMLNLALYAENMVVLIFGVIFYFGIGIIVSSITQAMQMRAP